jgi:transposase-like protein
MRYPASEKLEIIRLVEQSRLSARRTLQKLGIARSTFFAGMIASSLAADSPRCPVRSSQTTS